MTGPDIIRAFLSNAAKAKAKSTLTIAIPGAGKTAADAMVAKVLSKQSHYDVNENLMID
jgi:type IV pilus biogenesis protein CpaD/CtpE